MSTPDFHRRPTLAATAAATATAPITPITPITPSAPLIGIEGRLLALVESELALPARSVHLGTPIDEVGDSLDWLELLSTVEEVFGVELDAASTRSIRTLGDLLRQLPPERGDRPDPLAEDVQRVLGRSVNGPF